VLTLVRRAERSDPSLGVAGIERLFDRESAGVLTGQPEPPVIAVHQSALSVFHRVTEAFRKLAQKCEPWGPWR
jgi:hypothetical protein